jgi:ABC-type polysaccharide/polyol phosphate transport system ATPase subunit
MSDFAIQCRHISKAFTRHDIPVQRLQDKLLHWRGRKSVRIEAVRDVSLDVRRGEWLGIYGPNGSGKTTLLKILAGLLPQDGGTVSVDGNPSCFFELGTGFHNERRARENIMIHCVLRGLSRRETLDVTERIIDIAGVRSHVDLPLKCYSTGMRMRLAFAAASQIDTSVYIFDEILAVGDEEFRRQCWGHLDALKKRGKTAVIVSHYYGELEHCCDRIVSFDQGTIAKTHDVTIAAA